MQKLFLKGLGITLLLNLLVKPATIFLVDVKMQNILGAESYGAFTVILDFTFLFSMLLDLGMTNYMTRLIAQNNSIVSKYSDKLLSIRIVLLISYVSFTLFLFVVANQFNPVKFSFDWFWLLLALIFHQININTVNYVRAFTGGLLKFSIDAILSVTERMVYFVLGLVLLYTKLFHDVSIKLFAFIFVSSSFVSLLLSIIVYVKIVAIRRFEWDKNFFYSVIRKTYPYAFLVILMMLTTRLSTILLTAISSNMHGNEQVHYYTQSFRLLDACWMFSVLFGSILLPVFSRVLKDKGSTTGIMTSAFNLLLSGGLIMIAVTIGLRELIFNAVYTDANAYSYNAWVFHSMAFVPMCFTIVFGTLLTANGSMRRLNQMALISLLVMIILNCCLVPFFGAIGAACAMFFSQLTLGVLQFLEVKYKMKHQLARFTWRKMGGLALVLGTVLYMQRTFDLGTSNFVLLAGGLWLALIFSLRIIDVRQIIGMLQKKSD